MLFIKLVLSTLTLAAVVVAEIHGAPGRRHADISSLHTERDPSQNGTLLKRGQTFQNVRFSRYSPQTGNQVACGGLYQDTDWVVALNAPQFESIPGHMCGQEITISLDGKTAQATIVDEVLFSLFPTLRPSIPCPSCPEGGIDCTPAIATFFGFYNDITWAGGWNVGDGDPAPTTSSIPPPPPTTSKTPDATSTPPPLPPSSSSAAFTSSSTWSSASLSSVWSSASSSASASSSSATSSSRTSSASTPPTAAPIPISNLAALYANLVNMALLALASENGQ
ncbi:uncharacterized protein PHACADRAFT_198799 [Phanerochaete carnosa HHB-10118-sp]|uniref:Uncharacterized protein n=1 Tax=Phanerochaete carnosa (strain HHB-10118-sp) TaxID=650164 RepID=K5VMS1_PHACS|nr:uncharacterized protein PHACADRAFT_198799 [Phanerochaete carnosa HHB-10118-sp]EKM52753.1 hypothetical protein PHACADRAFT_198799 [Phanerochaete carnosa HHB-10118-sp]